MSHKLTNLQRNRLGTVLERERMRQGVEIELLADVLEHSKKHLRNVENGQSAPSFGLFVRWSHALGVEPHELLERTNL